MQTKPLERKEIRLKFTIEVVLKPTGCIMYIVFRSKSPEIRKIRLQLLGFFKISVGFIGRYTDDVVKCDFF